jgi:hypothetical protein
MLAYAVLFMSAAAALALPTKPKPIVAPEQWLGAANFSGVERTATTTFDIVIDVEGRAFACTTIVRSGVDSIDRRVCEAVIDNAKFRPAKDALGNAVPSVIRERLVWKPTGSGYSEWFEAPDYVIEAPTVSRKSKKFASVAVAYRANGEIEACHIVKSTKDVSLDGKACSFVRLTHASSPVLRIAGERTPVIRFLNVGFIYGTGDAVTTR